MVAAAVVLAVLAVVRLRAPIGPVAGVAATALLIVAGLVAGLRPGGDWASAAGLAAAGVALIAIGYAVAVAVPAIRRRAFHDYRMGARDAAYTALVAVPLATVFLEEIAFRGVLWGLAERQWGPWWAAAVTSVLYGLWHARPRRDPPLVILGTVVFTTLAGAVFAFLRHEGGNVLAPIAVHWAANGLGVLVSAWAWRRSRSPE
ncbi:MAG: CPBP family intramembrane glutamic endopeptidase [Actinoplanes sp.]